MLIALIGENCSGKSTLAEKLKEAIGAEVVTGRDWLRLAKSESEAAAIFRKRLEDAVGGSSLIYVISEQEQVKLLPQGAVRVLVYADLEVIKQRFAARMHGDLPAPVAMMLEKKHGMFDGGEYDYRFDGVNGSADALCDTIKSSAEGVD